MTDVHGLGRWLVTGAGGMLGRDLVAQLADHEAVQLTAASRADLDITDAARVAEAVAGHQVVINAAAYTDVDGAETDERTATVINGEAVALLARACADSGSYLVHISTDYVFPGDVGASRPTPFAEDAPTNPINAYGRSKLFGERAVIDLLPTRGYVARTSWLYSGHATNFVTTILRLAGQRDTLDVVDDQIGQPTWSRAVARQLVELATAACRRSAPPGIYHATSAGQTSWYGLARAVFAEAGLDPDRVRPTTADRFPRPARRPPYSALSHDRWREANLPEPAHWRAMLTDAFAHSELGIMARGTA